MPKEGHIGATTACGSASGKRATLQAIWQEDRYKLVFACLGKPLRSVESDNFDTPVFTEVHQQGDLLFVSGASGGRQWSASIETLADTTGNSPGNPTGGFLFDTACRVTKPTDHPAATCYEGNGWQVTTVADDPHPPSITHDAAIALWQVAPADAAETPPYTIRYRYRVVAIASD